MLTLYNMQRRVSSCCHLNTACPCLGPEENVYVENKSNYIIVSAIFVLSVCLQACCQQQQGRAGMASSVSEFVFEGVIMFGVAVLGVLLNVSSVVYFAQLRHQTAFHRLSAVKVPSSC